MHTSKFQYLKEISDAKQKVQFETVESKELETLHKNLNQIEKSIYTLGSSYLDNEFETLKKFKTIVSSTIDEYSFKLNEYFSEKDWAEVATFFNNLYEINNDLLEISRETFKIINDLKKGNVENNMRRMVSQLVINQENNNIAIISNYIDEIFKKENPQIDILKPTQFVKMNIFYDTVIFIGTPYLYGKFDTLFLGKNIIYVSYRFYRNKLIKKKYTDSNSDKANQIYKNIEFIENNNEERIVYHEEMTISELERMNLNRWIEQNILDNTSDNINELEDNEELISSKIVQLDNNKHYIILPESSLRKLEVGFDIDSNKIVTIKKSKMSNIKVGDWIILKTDTEEEYLVKRAKEIYGESTYNSQLNLITVYKDDLKKRKKTFGTYYKFMKDLNKNNVKVSSVALIQNWIKDTIRPRNLQNILVYLGYEKSKIDRTLSAAKFINQSHRKAGRGIGNRLNNYLKNLDVEELEEAMVVDGEYTFYLDKIGEFNVVTVKDIIAEEIKINRKELYRIINTKEELYYE